MLGRVNFLSLSSSTQYFYHCCPAINIFIIAVHHSILCHCCPALNIFYHCCPALNIFIIAVQHSIFYHCCPAINIFYHCCPPLNIFVTVVQHSVFFIIVVQHSIFLSLLSTTQYFCQWCPTVSIFIPLKVTYLNNTHRECIVAFVFRQWSRERTSEWRCLYFVGVVVKSCCVRYMRECPHSCTTNVHPLAVLYSTQ